MNSDNDLKQIVKEKYAEIALQAEKKGCGCGCGSSKVVDYTIIKDEYHNMDGYVAEADLNLGCGLPTEYAGIKKGDIVVDLGSGAGNDVFVARSLVGNDGKVIGVDMTEEMVKKANGNKEKLNAPNVEFKLGEIENLPLENNLADVVISNCVLNLVPNKKKAFSEVYRILKDSGHFCISDIVIKGDLPAPIKKSAEMYAGCVAGALQQEEYLNTIKEAGFKKIEIKKTKIVDLPDELLRDYLSNEEIRSFRESKTGIFSITVNGYKS